MYLKPHVKKVNNEVFPNNVTQFLHKQCAISSFIGPGAVLLEGINDKIYFFQKCGD